MSFDVNISTIMLKRFLTTIVLATALLFSQAGNFLVGALCPHQLGMTSCTTELAAPTMSHEDMGHMAMEHEAATNEDSDILTVDEPVGPCSHCAVHSRTIPNTASLLEPETSKRSLEVNIALRFSKVPPLKISPAEVLAARAHGPPGETTPRHILINIFRI